MNRREHLLTLLMEECVELAHAAAKTQRFTEYSTYDGISNLEKLNNEFNDVLGVLRLLKQDGILILEDEDRIRQKMDKVEFFLEDSKNCGTLD